MPTTNQQPKSIKFFEENFSQLITTWHFHEEHKLIYIAKGKGILHVGDSVGNFEMDDLFYIGSHIPYKLEKQTEHNEMEYQAYVLQIDSNFFNQFDIKSKDFIFIQTFLETSKRGSKYMLTDNYSIPNLLKDFINNDDNIYQNAINFLNIILQLSNLKSENLASRTWINKYSVYDKRLDKVKKYIIQNIHKPITLLEIANIAGMNKTAFCRYFRSKTEKSYTFYVNELRISIATQLLSDERKQITVSEACYQTGFNSLSYFNKIFKKINGISPSDYKKKSYNIV